MSLYKLIDRLDIMEQDLMDIDRKLYGTDIRFEYIIDEDGMIFKLYYRASYVYFNKYFSITHVNYENDLEQKGLENQFNILKGVTKWKD